MITNKLSQNEPPLNYPHSNLIDDLIFKQINYTKEIVNVDVGGDEENLIFRDVNFTPKPEKNLFNYISDDCNPPTIFEESTEEKYQRLIKKQKSCDSSNDLDENIDNLINNITSEISAINGEITRTRILTRAPWAYLQEDDLIFEEEDKKILKKCNEILQNFINEEDRLSLTF
jgi:hypothetical protein